jgi:hypothetical protein
MANKSIVLSAPLGTILDQQCIMSLSACKNSNRLWGDIVMEQEEYFLRMWEGDWRQVATDHVSSSKCPEAAEAWVRMIERDREPYLRDRAPFPMNHHRPDPILYQVWKDMVDEPAKFGDDLLEVLQLEDKLMRAARTRQRVIDYWQEKDIAERQVPAIRLIQRAWRNRGSQ